MKKDLKTETKHQRWSSWISTSGVVSTAATAAARVRAWSSAFAAPRIVRQCYCTRIVSHCSIFIPFYSFYIQNLWIFGKLLHGFATISLFELFRNCSEKMDESRLHVRGFLQDFLSMEEWRSCQERFPKLKTPGKGARSGSSVSEQ